MRNYSGYTLFLDRDGVLNRRIENNYVTTPQQFEIIDGVLEAMQIFDSIFDKILIVTNQQGIGKGLMTEEGLHLIHNEFIQKVNSAGGRIDKIYFCAALEKEGSFNRKPNIGMALQAKKDFPEIRFNRSVMVGDSLGDMNFGKRTGMTTVFIGNYNQMALRYPNRIDFQYKSLFDFADAIKQ